MSKAKVPQVSNADLRSQLNADVDKFLKSGKKIQQIPTGVSSQDYSKGRKQIVLGNSKQRSELANQQQAKQTSDAGSDSDEAESE